MGWGEPLGLEELHRASILLVVLRGHGLHAEEKHCGQHCAEQDFTWWECILPRSQLHKDPTCQTEQSKDKRQAGPWLSEAPETQYGGWQVACLQ